MGVLCAAEPLNKVQMRADRSARDLIEEFDGPEPKCLNTAESYDYQNVRISKRRSCVAASNPAHEVAV